MGGTGVGVSPLYLAPSVTGGSPPGSRRALALSKMGFISSGVASYLTGNITPHHRHVACTSHTSAYTSQKKTSKHRRTDETCKERRQKDDVLP